MESAIDYSTDFDIAPQQRFKEVFPEVTRFDL